MVQKACYLLALALGPTVEVAMAEGKRTRAGERAVATTRPQTRPRHWYVVVLVSHRIIGRNASEHHGMNGLKGSATLDSFKENDKCVIGGGGRVRIWGVHSTGHA